MVFAISLQARDQGPVPLSLQDTLPKKEPVFLPAPLPEYWGQLQDTIPDQVPPPVLSDSMLWSYLYEEDATAKSVMTIIGTGDIMLGTSYPDERYLPPGGDCSPLLRPVQHILQSGDVLFGNLEGTFCSEGGTPKKCRDPNTCYVFRMPDQFLSADLQLIVCATHGAQFEIHTGRCVSGPCLGQSLQATV